MTARHYYNAPGGSDVEMTESVLRVGWEVRENAEEGATAIVTIDVADPDMTLDFSAWRRWLIVEDASTATDHVVFAGAITEQVISRGQDEHFEPLGRVWTLSLADDNNRWRRRVMLGNDCKRPAETDVARMQWLLGTSEIEYGTYLTDTTTYVSTASPVSMDPVDYRGQMVEQVVDDCAQASGKNWWIQTIYDGADYNPTAWYGKGSLTTYTSPLSLSNDPADWTDAALLDGSSLVWPYSEETQLRRDYGRVFAGIYLPYNGGAVYRKNTATLTAYTLRDGVMPSLNVKSASKASARAIRYLDDLATPDERITTRVRLPKAIATKIRAGMRVRFKGVHLPGYEDFQYCRVLNCAPKPVAAGGYYDLSLELEGNPGEPPASCSVASLTTGIVNDQASTATSTSVIQSTSLPITTPSGTCVVVGGLMVTSGSLTPKADNGDAVAPSVNMYDDRTISLSPLQVALYRTGVSGATTLDGQYTTGYFAIEHWAMAAVAFASSASAPVQEAHGTFNTGVNAYVTFGADPTPGNLVVAVVSVRARATAYDGGSLSPAMTLMAQAQNHDTWSVGTGYDTLAVYAACVVGGEGKTWGVPNAYPGEKIVSVSEWAL